MQKIKIFSFQKDEELIEDWILYHGALVGYPNIYIVDHDSKQSILDVYAKYDVNVISYNGKFEFKVQILTKLMLEHKSTTDLLIPLDGDEFIALKDGKILSKDKHEIQQCLYNLPKGPHKYNFATCDAILEKYEYTDIFNEINYFSEIKRGFGEKTFFQGYNFVELHNGNHLGVISDGRAYIKTDLVLLHFNCKGYENFLGKIIKGMNACGYDLNKNYTISATMDKKLEKGKHWYFLYQRYKNGNLKTYMDNTYMFDEKNKNKYLTIK